jgi:hypothetical protein
MEGLLNKKYNLELEVISPIHVGVGQEKDWMKGADFVEQNGRIYVLNQKKVAKIISSSKYAGYLLEKDDKGLIKSLGDKLKSVSDLVFDAPNTKTDNDIKVFVKNGLTNKPIVPGSSIKGSIRSILLKYFTDGNINKNDRRFEEEVFGSANKGNEFMRFIKIADAQFDKTELINTKIFNLFGGGNLSGGWKHSGKNTNATFSSSGFNTFYEVLNIGEVGSLSISLSEKAFDNLKKERKIPRVSKEDKKKKVLHNSLTSGLFKIINIHTRDYINKQISFFEKYSNAETDNIISNLRNILSQIPDDDSSCILKMSAGSGFHSITGDWQFDDYSINKIKVDRGRSRGTLNNKDSAKSRKIAINGDNFYLMGFVKILNLTEEEKAKREAYRIAKIKEEQRLRDEQIAEEKAEQEKIEAEKRAKEEAKRKAELERIAIENAKREEIERLKKQKEEEERKRQEANKEKRGKLAEEGLVVLNDINDFNKGKNIIREYKKISKSIDSTQFQYIKQFIIRSIPNSKPADWKNIKRGNWKDVKKWVGAETAQQWYDEIIKK